MAESKVEYEDDTPVVQPNPVGKMPIESLAAVITNDLRHKRYGVDVRESLARWVEAGLELMKNMNDEESNFEIQIANKQASVQRRQTAVEKRQSDLEDDFKTVVSKATKDSELLLARNSSRYGNYIVVDDRLEHIESLLSAYVPVGFTVTIKHNQNRKPTKAEVEYYEYALGTEPDGLGTGPEGTFGGTTSQIIPAKIDYPDDDTIVFHLPTDYALSGVPVYEDGYWYLIDGYKTLRFNLGDDLDDKLASSGNGNNTTATDGTNATKPDTGETTELKVPYDLIGTPLDDTTEELNWKDDN